MSLLDQLNAMSLAADSAKKEVTAKGAEIEAGSKRIRRKSRDLETDFFGKFLEEAKSEDAAFDEFDTDKSGTIDQEELRAALLKVKITTPPPDAVFKRMIDKFADVDVPGKTQKELSREGFKSLVNAIKDGSFDEFMADAVDDNLKVLFSAVDINGDGAISKQELESAFKNTEGCKAIEMSEEQWKSLMKYADSPKDEAEKTEFTVDAFKKLVTDVRAGKLSVSI